MHLKPPKTCKQIGTLYSLKNIPTFHVSYYVKTPHYIMNNTNEWDNGV